MKKFYIIILFIISITKSFAWHETKVSNEDVAVLGGLWVQIFVYEQHCQDNQYYQTVIERLPLSPRFNQYSSEIEHFSLPEWVDQEVTFQEKYFNMNLLSNPYNMWS